MILAHDRSLQVRRDYSAALEDALTKLSPRFLFVAKVHRLQFSQRSFLRSHVRVDHPKAFVETSTFVGHLEAMKRQIALLQQTGDYGAWGHHR